jgi:L-alanine-DL-glutamate epimerase-like enolase superfamily enzyme
MRIAEIESRVLDPATEPIRFMDSMPSTRFEHCFISVTADDGTSGQCITYLMNIGEFEHALPGLRRMLCGRDPHEIERISARLTGRMERPSAVASAIDICLWDLLGKHHREPIYRLLGGARNRIRAYASTYTYDTVEEYVTLAEQCANDGFTALKLHAHGVPSKDIAVCRAVREAVGDSMDLMLDPVNVYDRQGALQVGKALQELDYLWFEAPISDSDHAGLQHLRQHLTIPIAGAESVVQGLRAYPPFLTGNLVDALRSVGDQSGGISAMRKTAALCEAFNIKYEPHSYGTTTIQAAHQHVMLSIFHCDFVELPVPRGVWDFAMHDTIWIDDRGDVHAPDRPGLGYAIDMDAIDAITSRNL